MSRLLSTLALLLVSTQAQAECLTTPDLQDHRGYWRYHLIWKTGQRCWYQDVAGRIRVRPTPSASLTDDMPIPPAAPVEQPSEPPPKSAVALRFDETFGAVTTDRISQRVEVITETQRPKIRPRAIESTPSNNRLVQLLDALGIAIFVVTLMYGPLTKYRDRWAHSWQVRVKRSLIPRLSSQECAVRDSEPRDFQCASAPGAHKSAAAA
jgi:hypothetical protein